MDVPLRVLVIEDSLEDTILMTHELRRGGLELRFERVETRASLRAAFEARTWDLIICDSSLPQLPGEVALAIYRQQGLDIPFIVVSGTIGEEAVAEMLKAGAHDYVLKQHFTRLVPVVKSALAAAQQERIRRRHEATVAFLASIVESCDDAIVGKTLEGTVVSWNAGAERLYGYTAAEIIGRPISGLIPVYRPNELPEIIERIKAGERVEDFETVRIRKDGSAVEVLLCISPIKDAEGRIVGASAIARDISRQKRDENERLGLIQELTAALAHSEC